jgi:monoamine oxidase
MDEVDVVVVGAGVAGLAAAAVLRAAGRRVAILEAAERIGGRAFTDYPAALGGDPFDHGATWLHNADHNPLLPIARRDGARLIDSDSSHHRRCWIGKRWASEEEWGEYDAAWDHFIAVVEQSIANGNDTSLLAAAAALQHDPWLANIAFWEGPIIGAVDAAAFSARDWLRNRLAGRNLMIEGGLGAFIARALGQMTDGVRLSAPVQRVAWNGRGRRVSVETPHGTVAAAACIVTVSTGVLRAGTIRFDPALPERTQQAIEGLPMGSVMKIAMRATGVDRLDLPDHCSVERRIARPDEPAMIFFAWPLGLGHIVGFVGGHTARELAAMPAAAAAEFARAELRRLFGSRVDRAFDGVAVTAWDADPWHLGAYAYAAPGAADARAALAAPLPGGRLLFAGEACHTGLAGTVGGAFESGQAAARQALTVLGA